MNPNVPGIPRVTHVTTYLAIAAIAATAFIYNRWLLDARTFFFADDWQWLWRAEFFPWSDPFYAILPSWAYNDRPVGAAFIKVIYQIAGLNHRAFQFALLFLHAANCILLYAIAAPYIGRGRALVAGLLAATWFSANEAVGWTAAVFDVLGATLCLATILLRQRSCQSGNAVRYDLAGAVLYALAIRTKEFALGMVAVLLLMNFLVERRSVRATLKDLWPYLVVFAVFAIRYAQLLVTTQPASGTPYHLELSLPGLLTSLGFYVSTMFNQPFGVPPIVVGGLTLAMGGAVLLAEDRFQRAAVWGVLVYLILLGPVLLLTAHPHALYLYAPHFFLCLAIAALISRRLASIALIAVVMAGVLVPPMWTLYRHDIIDFHLTKGYANQVMFNSAVKLLTPLAPGSTVFIAGVEPVFNPFWILPGSSLKTAFKDFNLTVVTEMPEAALAAKFCKTPGAKRFLRFEGTRPTEVTSEVAARCAVTAP